MRVPPLRLHAVGGARARVVAAARVAAARMAAARAAALLVVVVSTAGCPNPLDPGTTPHPAELNLQLRLRPSCGFDTADYKTSCLAAVVVIVREPRDADGNKGDEIQRACGAFSSPPADLQTLVLSEDPYVTFGSLTTEGSVVFEILGLHNKASPTEVDGGPLDPCADIDEADPSHWLFFGESADPFDLGTLQDADASSAVVEIPVDCRDCENGCVQLGQPTCPVNPISFCVPGSANLTCEKPCSDPSDCFEGLLETCDEERQRCDQDSAEPGGFCSYCTNDGDCLVNDGFFCVGLPGETFGLCAQRCPQNRCVNGTKCNRLGNRLRRIDFASSPDDGGTP